MSKYQRQHYDDVARVLSHARAHEPRFGTGEFTAIGQAIIDFADLFAADNPPYCQYCRNTPTPASAATQCVQVHLGEPHEYIGGFDRERFLKACGLESA